MKRKQRGLLDTPRKWTIAAELLGRELLGDYRSSPSLAVGEELNQISDHSHETFARGTPSPKSVWTAAADGR